MITTTVEWDYTALDADEADEDVRVYCRKLEAYPLRGWYVEHLALFEDEPSALRFLHQLGVADDPELRTPDGARIGYWGPSVLLGDGLQFVRQEYEQFKQPYAVYVAKRLPQGHWI